MLDIAEQNKALVKRLLDGDTTARNELIEFNHRLVFTTVRRFLGNWPSFNHLESDLIGSGMIALVLAVDRLAEVGDVNRPIRNYLIAAIRNKLRTELAEEMVHQRVRRINDLSYADSSQLAVDDPVFQQIDNKDFLFSLCGSERERIILTHLLDGQKLPEIIETTGLTRKVVYTTLQQFRQKVRKNVSGLASV